MRLPARPRAPAAALLCNHPGATARVAVVVQQALPQLLERARLRDDDEAAVVGGAPLVPALNLVASPLDITARSAPDTLRAAARLHGLASAMRLPELAPLALQRSCHRLRQAAGDVKAGGARCSAVVSAVARLG